MKYPWIVRSTAMVNHYYFYILDQDFGPLFIKFCSYFAYAVKLCLNGHEWLKRQLDKRGMVYEPLDVGIGRCREPKRAQRIAEQLEEKRIEAVFRKWLARLPHSFSAQHRAAGYRYQLSVLQAEFALAQVLDRPLRGRCFFEEVMRENLDLGRPDKVQLIFERRVTRRTPGRFRTRVLTSGVVPSLHVQYKNSKIKQYHKEGQALRSETTINDTYDFQIGRSLSNLCALRKIGYEANRRSLRLHGLMERIPRTDHYRITEAGIRAALFYTRPYARALRPALSRQPTLDALTRPQRPLDRLDAALGNSLQEVQLAA